MIVTTTARPSGHPGYTETLPCTAPSAATARRLVRTALAVWGIEHCADAATLIVSELVANAVDHTDCRVMREECTWRWGADRLPWGKRVWDELRCEIDE
ncbi:ATP-binding protein [Streptomyces asiaticus]|uniref:ATP-binding protein n=1 Tax=Streptomyces asiaticus TaxID=114695 RepID=UPI003D729B02